MKCFASVDTFVETAASSLKIGRLVANFEFLKALLTYGTFDQYHLFSPALENQRLLSQRLEATLDRTSLARVVLSHHFYLPNSLAQNDYDAFHLGDWYCYLPQMATLRAQYSRQPFPLTGPIHSINSTDEVRKITELLRAPIRPWDAVICTSRAGQQAFRNQMAMAKGIGTSGVEPRLEVLPLGVPASAFERRDRQASRRQLGLPAEGACFLYLGRMSISSKGDLVPLLYCFRMLLEGWKEGPPPHLVLAGSAGKSDLALLVNEVQRLEMKAHVTFRPEVEDEEKQQLLSAADVFLSPVDNLQETFGISVGEAMAAGLPAVVTDFDGYRDLVVEGETGFLIPTLWQRPPELLLNLRSILEQKVSGVAFSQSFAIDLEALRDRMRRLAEDADLRARLGEAGRRRALEHFGWDRIIPRYEALWAELKADALRRSNEPWPAPVPHAASLLFEAFGHYATRLLQSEDSLALTPLTEKVLEGSLPMPPTYEDVSILLPDDLLRAIVGAVHEKTEPWGALREELSLRFGMPRDLLDYQVLWLLKHGLLTRG